MRRGETIEPSHFISRLAKHRRVGSGRALVSSGGGLIKRIPLPLEPENLVVYGREPVGRAIIILPGHLKI